MAVLTTAARKKLPSKSFALPGKGAGPHGKGAGSYPIPDRSHARNALARVSQHGTASEKATVRAKVHAKYPDIGKKQVGGVIPPRRFPGAGPVLGRPAARLPGRAVAPRVGPRIGGGIPARMPSVAPRYGSLPMKSGGVVKASHSGDQGPADIGKKSDHGGFASLGIGRKK